MNDSSEVSLDEEQKALLLDLLDIFRSTIATCEYLDTASRCIRNWINEKNEKNPKNQITDELLFSNLLIGVSENPTLFGSLLAFFYDRGIGTTRDRTKAIEFYSKNANTGDPLAQNELGYIYENKDFTLARNWYNEAVKSRWPDSFDNLGRVYYDGIHVDQDFRASAYYFRLGAELGHVNSQLYMVSIFQYGYGVMKDLHSSIYWIHKIFKNSKNSKELKVKPSLREIFNNNYF
ncbi:1156_t:CDS:1 [Ambispora leptoticha]|uniref:1156_t:CDS:1 n=1 Tax=Ambispora leptoticha TaxID=144679 RepID=A0A9N8WI14_9GLOM|nr:1156_t:CDS:1 [Ambispora leptoticha]